MSNYQASLRTVKFKAEVKELFLKAQAKYIGEIGEKISQSDFLLELLIAFEQRPRKLVELMNSSKVEQK